MLDSNNINSIIEACAKNNVTVLKFGDLELNFGQKYLEPKTGTEIPVQEPKQVNTNSDKEISEQHNTSNKAALEVDELDIRREQLDLMMIEDPVRYEELMRNGELEEPDDAEQPGDE